MWPFDRTKRRLKSLQAQISHLCHEFQASLETVSSSNQEIRVQQGAISDKQGAILAKQVAISDQQGAISDQQGAILDQQGAIFERLEFVRREILFEIQHGDARQGRAARKTSIWRVVSVDKVQAGISEGLSLNLGCGHIAMPGYVNIDARALPGVDIVADVADLQLPEGSAREIFSAHLLEHFPQEQLRRSLLPHWMQLMRSDAIFRAIVPDTEAMLAALAQGVMCYDDFREVIFGAQDYTGDFHFNMFTPGSLFKLLTEAGFRDVEVLDKGRRNGKCFELEITARR